MASAGRRRQGPFHNGSRRAPAAPRMSRPLFVDLGSVAARTLNGGCYWGQ